MNSTKTSFSHPQEGRSKTLRETPFQSGFEGFDQGEKSQAYKESKEYAPEELTVHSYELQTVHVVHENAEKFTTTQLNDEEQVVNDKKQHQRRHDIETNLKGSPFETEERKAERVRRLTQPILENLVSHWISTFKRMPEVLDSITSDLDETDITQKRKKLEKNLETFTQLRENIWGVVGAYFSHGIRMIRQYEQLFPTDFNEKMPKLIEQLYLRAGMDTKHTPPPSLFANVLHEKNKKMIFDPKIDRIEELLIRLVEASKHEEQEQSNHETNKVIPFEEVKRKAQVQADQGELVEHVETIKAQHQVGQPEVSDEEQNQAA